MTTYVTKADDVIDEVCHEYYGRTDGTVEAVLAANPTLRNRPARLPAGVKLTLPDVTAPTPTRINLFD